MSSELRVDKIIPVDGVPTGGGGGIVRMQIANSTTNEQNTSGDQTWTLVGPQITHTALSSTNKLVFLHNHHIEWKPMINLVYGKLPKVLVVQW